MKIRAVTKDWKTAVCREPILDNKEGCVYYMLLSNNIEIIERVEEDDISVFRFYILGSVFSAQ